MTAPSDPEDAPELREEEPEIVLRLGDILPRVPPDLLKPGPHDTALQVRFSIDELAEKIARGRVSVPLERLSSAFPNVFRDKNNFPDEVDVPLPLQRLLDQVGLVARKTAPVAVPADQVSLARAEAGRIIEANASRPVPEFATAPSVHSVRIAKAIFTARQVFGLFSKPESGPKVEEGDQPAAVPENGNDQTAVKPEPTPPPAESLQPYPPPSESPSAPAASAAEPAPELALEPAAVSTGSISMRVLPILRLLPPSILKSMPADENVRVALAFSSIEPQLAGGHVEVPLEDFIKALPDTLRGYIHSEPGAQVWIPLDEIFQNLPASHPFYMPPLDAESDTPITTPSETTAEKIEDIAGVQSTSIPAGVPEPSPAIVSAPNPEPIMELPPPVVAPINQEPKPVSETIPNIPATPEALTSETSTPPAEAPVATPVEPEAKVPEAPKSSASEPSPPATSASAPLVVNPYQSTPPNTVQASRAPWMRGFQVPPPRVFATASQPPLAATVPDAPPPVETPPTLAPTPEAKRTADFLAGQTGIFAAAAFVEGAVFASEDFPRKPDLDALREFMGAFIERAEETGRRLGWNRSLSFSCEQFHLTAVVRDRHFIVALHHDRTLPPPTYDALIIAADELAKSSDTIS
jgi:hypothetical protein